MVWSGYLLHWSSLELWDMVPYPVLVSLSFESLVRARCTGLFPLWAGILLCSYPLDRLAAAVTCLAQAQVAARRQHCDRFSRPCLQVAILLPALPGTSLRYRCCPAYAWQACVRAATHQPCLAPTRKEGRKEGDVRSGRSPLAVDNLESVARLHQKNRQAKMLCFG